MHLKVLIVYHSYSGNTKLLAEMIEGVARGHGHNTMISSVTNTMDIDDYDLMFIGSCTWGDGELPREMRSYLRWLLKENTFDLPIVSVFGTGDTQWPSFCRAVDEIQYHVSKYTKVFNQLKIEQSPINDKDKVKKYVCEVLEVANAIR